MSSLNTMNFVPYFDDYTKYGITEDDINRITVVICCHPNFLTKEVLIKKITEQLGSTENILFVANRYLEDENSVVVIGEEALKKAFIINHLISMKKENKNNEEN